MARRISETKHEHRLLVSNYFYPDPFVLEYFFLLQKLQKNYHRSSLAHTRHLEQFSRARSARQISPRARRLHL